MENKEQFSLFDGPSVDLTPAYKLNVGQQEAHDWLVPFCLGTKEDRKILLEGWAGTGKSFLINRVVESARIIDDGVNFGMTAPTHKAVRVLKKSSELKDVLDFGTIHSFLGLKEKINHITGKVTYEPEYLGGKPRRIDGIDILIVDESSMLGDDLFEHIENELRSNRKLRVIYMGDSLQLPPVGKKQKTGVAFAIPFIPERRTSHKIHHLVLTEPQRQAADSPIIAYATAIRQQHHKQNIDFEFKEEYKHALELLPQNMGQLKDLFSTYFKTQQFKDDPDYAKVVAWRNDRVNYFNSFIRTIIYEKDLLPKFMLAEQLIMDKPFVVKDKVVIANNEEIEVLDVNETVINIKYTEIDRGTTVFTKETAFEDQEIGKKVKIWTPKVYVITVRTPEKKVHQLTVLHEESEQDYTLIRSTLEGLAKKNKDQFDQKEMWKQFYGVEKHFAWVKYNYCVTSHKSQGSTYQFVFSMEFDMNANRDIPERNSLKYVASTRAKQKLFIVK